MEDKILIKYFKENPVKVTLPDKTNIVIQISDVVPYYGKSDSFYYCFYCLYSLKDISSKFTEKILRFYVEKEVKMYMKQFMSFETPMIYLKSV